ncbi:MAG: carotenoid oxygenase family protein [Candidatus Cyclobacteriaceae bacterium M2_1C_046]
MTKPTYSLGFKSQNNELRNAELSVKGKIPSWLKGTLLRTAPSKFEIGKDTYRHWFDGLSMIHKFKIENEGICYSNKYLESEAYKTAKAENRVVYGEFGTDPCRDIFQKIATFFKGPVATDNGCVNVIKFPEGMTAVTETTKPVRFNPETLETKGHLYFDDKLKGRTTVVHPHYDSKGNMFSYMTHFGAKSYYNIYRLPADSDKREIITSVPVKEPSYMHSFGMTENYILLTEFPLVVHPLKMRFSQRPFIEKYSWKEDYGTKIHVINKNNGNIKSFNTDPFFAFHHVNAFEADGEITFDLVGYKNAGIIEGLYLDRLNSDDGNVTAGNLWRFKLSLDNGSISKKVVSDSLMDLPRINYEKVNCRPYRYVYAAGIQIPGNFFDSLIKVDVETGEVKVWKEDNCFPGEPVFVEKPGANKEDDGVILSIVLDAESNSSFLLILDAKNFKEAARAEVPQHITFGFHGQFISQ